MIRLKWFTPNKKGLCSQIREYFSPKFPGILNRSIEYTRNSHYTRFRSWTYFFNSVSRSSFISNSESNNEPFIEMNVKWMGKMMNIRLIKFEAWMSSPSSVYFSNEISEEIYFHNRFRKYYGYSFATTLLRDITLIFIIRPNPFLFPDGIKQEVGPSLKSSFSFSVQIIGWPIKIHTKCSRVDR